MVEIVELYNGTDTVVDDEDEWSDESEDGDDEEEIASETLIDKISALKDIVPAHQRDAIARTVSKAYSYGTVVTFIGGKAAYMMITSVLILGIPYALMLEEDKIIAEQERQMQMSQDIWASILWLGLTDKVLAPTAGETLAAADPAKPPIKPPGL
jgi:import receptor subunit TOM22